MSESPLTTYGGYLETLSPERLQILDQFVAPDVHFRDPFNDCHGIADMRRVLEHMYATLDNVRFTVSSSAMGDHDGFLAWRFDCDWRGRRIGFEGVSQISFDEDGLVRRHVDHWDAASDFYERLPVIGPQLRFLRRRIAAV